MQTPFKTERMTMDEFIAHHGDTLADVTYTMALYQPSMLTVTVLHERLAWKGEYVVADGVLYLTALSADASHNCTPRPEHVRHILEQVRKTLS